MRSPSYKELFEYAKEVIKDDINPPLAQEPQIAPERDIIIKPAFGGSSQLLPQEVVDTQPTAPPKVPAVAPSSQSIASPQVSVSLPEEISTQPVVPPDTPPWVVGKEVLVVLETLEGSSPEEMKRLRDSLARLPIVKMVKEDAFFDRLIRGEKKNGRYHVRLLNGIGDVDKVEPADTIKKLVDSLSCHFEYAYTVKHLACIHHPNPPFKVETWVTDKSRRDFELGEKVVFGVEAERDCYILLINLDSKGNCQIIFPNQYHQENFIKANTTVLIPDEIMSK